MRRTLKGLNRSQLAASVRDQKRLAREKSERDRLKRYIKRKKVLSKIMNFSFKNRINFTSAQRAAITRAWKMYGHTANAVERGDFVFRKQPSRVRRQFANSKYDRFIGGEKITYDSIFHTNKGVIVHENKRYVGTVKYIGRGKNIKQVVTIPHVVTPSGVQMGYTETFMRRPKDEPLTSFVNRIFDDNNPQQIALSVNGYIGKEFFTYDQWLKYVERTIAEMEANNNTEFYNGIFLINLRFPITGKAVRRVKKKKTGSNRF